MNAKEELTKLLMESYDQGVKDGLETSLQLGKEQLTQPEQEPVAWISPSGALYRTRYHAVANAEQSLTPLYTHPTRGTWVGLTLTQVKLLGEGVQEEAIKSGHSRDWVFYAHINEALKEKNT